MLVKLVMPHLPTVPALLAADGQLEFSRKRLSSGTVTPPPRPRPQRLIASAAAVAGEGAAPPSLGTPPSPHQAENARAAVHTRNTRYTRPQITTPTEAVTARLADGFRWGFLAGCSAAVLLLLLLLGWMGFFFVVVGFVGGASSVFEKMFCV